MSSILISVIIPTYNEEGNVRRAYEAVKTTFANLSKYDFEIIFTDNFSTDNTFAMLAQLAAEDSRVRVARFSRNFGFNKSILTGYRLASGEAAIQMDCDLQDHPREFPQFLSLWEKGHDVVVGVRAVRQENPVVLALRKIYYRMLNQLTEDVLIIDGGDFRLVDKSILQLLRQIHDGKPYVRGLISSLAKNQIGIPYLRDARVKGQSKFPILKLLSLAVDGIVSHSTVPLRLASMAGLFVSIMTFVLAIFYFIGKIYFGLSWPSGFTTQVVLMLFGISLNAIFLGIIGEYLARIYHQLKQQPLTIIKDQINFPNAEVKNPRAEMNV